MFLQDEATRGDVDQGYEEVAEAAVDDVTGVYAPHVDEPVGGEQCRAESVDGERSQGVECAAHFAKPALGADHNQEKNQRPDVAMRDQFDWVYARQLFPIKWHQAPQKIAQRCGQRAAGLCRSMR